MFRTNISKWNMDKTLIDLYESIETPSVDRVEDSIYAVLGIPLFTSYFVGKDQFSRACILVKSSGQSRIQPSPIRLDSIDVQFELPCTLKIDHEVVQESRLTIVLCKSKEREIVRYFLSVCHSVVSILGNEPGNNEVATAFHRLAFIFQKLQKPSIRTLTGLIGELYLISKSTDPIETLKAWRIDDSARYDFVCDDVRIDVKSSSRRIRSHVFTYEQCNPPDGTTAVVASMFIEHTPNGMNLRDLIDQITIMVTSNNDLLFKLHEVVSTTLGSRINDAMTATFDERLARSSLRFFNLRRIPAIRDVLPLGVSELRFRSDLTGVDSLSEFDLLTLDTSLSFFLPR